MSGISNTKILSIQNYAKIHEEKTQQETIQAAIQAHLVAQSEENSESVDQSVSQIVQVDHTPTAFVEDDIGIDIVGIFGLTLCVCALVVGAINAFVTSSMKNQINANKDDLVSLGSKDVA